MRYHRRRVLPIRLRLTPLENRITPTLSLPKPLDTHLPDHWVYASQNWPSSNFDVFAPNMTPSINDLVPIVTESTRTGKSDETLAVTGEYLTSYSGADAGKDTQFLVFSQTNPGNASLVPGSILRLDGARAAVTLPGGDHQSDSMYFVWPSNSHGAGRPFAVNRPEAWWTQDKVSVGDIVSLHGRNLARKDSQGAFHSWVFLESDDGSKYQWVDATSADPYRVEFKMPSGFGESPHAHVHSGRGGVWGFSESLTLTIRNPPTMALGRSPTQKYEYDVTYYGAVPNDGLDDSSAISVALANATLDNYPGAYLYFPAGTYLVNSPSSPSRYGLEIPSNVSWIGHHTGGKNDSIIKAGDDLKSHYLLFGQVSNVMFKDLDFDAADGLRGTEIGVDEKGEPIYNWEALAINLRGSPSHICEDLVFDHVNITASRAYNPIDHTLYYNALDLINRVRVTMNDCTVTTSGGAFFGTSQQIFINGCDFYGTHDVGQLLTFWGADGVSITNCTAQDFGTGDDEQGQGRFIVTQDHWNSNHNFYIANNATHNLAPRLNIPDWLRNSGEQILFEGGTSLFHGRPIGQGTDTFKLAGLASNLLVDTKQFQGSRLTAVVVDGKGVGASREVTLISIDTMTINGSDVLTYATVKLDSPWLVEPDATSDIVLERALKHVAVYDNDLDGKEEWPKLATSEFYSASGGIQMRGPAFGVELVNNRIQQVETGIWILGFQWALGPDVVGRLAFGPSYFGLIAGNAIIQSAQGIRVGAQGGDPGYAPVGYGAVTLGTVVRGNTMKEDLQGRDWMNYGIAMNSFFDYRAVDLTIIEANICRDLAVGIDLSFIAPSDNIHNTIIRKNEFDVGAKVAPGACGVKFATGVYPPGAEPALFDNVWDDGLDSITFTNQSTGSAPGPVIEIPYRVFNVTTSGTFTITVPVYNCGPASSPDLDPAIWTGSSFSATFDGAVPGEGRGTVTVTGDASALAGGTYVFTVTIGENDQAESFTVNLIVLDTYNLPFTTPVPSISTDRVLTLEAESFNTTADLGYYDTTLGNIAGTYRGNENVDIVDFAPNEYAVTDIQDGEWMNYSVNVPTTGRFRLEIRANVLPFESGGSIDLFDAGTDTSLLTEPLTVEPSSNWFVLRYDSIELSAGIHILKAVFTSLDSSGFGALDWIRFCPEGRSFSCLPAPPVVSFYGATAILPQNFDMGGPGVGYNDLDLGNTASSFRAEEDVDLDTEGGSVYSIGGFAGEWLNYTIDVRNAGRYQIEFGVTNPQPGAIFELTDVGGLAPYAGGGSLPSAIVTLAAGVQTLRFTFRTDGLGQSPSMLHWIHITPAKFTALPPSSPSGATFTTSRNIEIGTRFAVNAPGYITELRFFMNAAEAAALAALQTKNPGYAHQINLWDGYGQLLVYRTTHVAMSGWYQFPIHYFVAPGTYVVSVNAFASYSADSLAVLPPVVPNLITFIAACRNTAYGGGDYPSEIATGPGGVYWVDVTFDPYYGIP